MRFQSANPSAPWLTASAVTALQDLLNPNDTGFEFGSGRSTVWLARRAGFLYSMEHNPEWFERVQGMLGRAGVGEKVTYELATEPRDLEDLLPETHPYVRRICETPDNQIDFVLVDGIMRLTCLRLAMRKLKPGGVLILDNANVYLPNKYENGYTTATKQMDEPRDEEWSITWAELSKWRGFNATDGIWDTRFWFKPPN